MENHTPCISKATSENKRNHSGRLPPKKNQLNCCVIAASAAVVPVEVNIVLRSVPKVPSFLPLPQRDDRAPPGIYSAAARRYIPGGARSATGIYRHATANGPCSEA